MIYLDHAATTKTDSRILAHTMSRMQEIYGNPSSAHRMGRLAEKEIKEARGHLAKALHTEAEKIFFCSGGTMGNNICIQGSIKKAEKRGQREIVAMASAHQSVQGILHYYEAQNFKVTRLSCDLSGEDLAEKILAQISEDTACVSLMHVHNETGTIFQIKEMASAIKSRWPHIHVHIDGIQAFGKINASMAEIQADSYVISGHKIGAMKGIGAFYLRDFHSISPLLFGASQEKGLVPGTENVPGIISLGKAAENLSRENHNNHLLNLKNYLKEKIASEIADIFVNTPDRAAPHILNLSFMGVKSEVLLHYLEQDEIYVSAGAACSAKKKKLNSALLGFGLDEMRVDSALRFSFGAENTQSEMDQVVEKLKTAVTEIRKVMKR